MKLIKTQAKTTRKYLVEAQNLVNDAVRQNNYRFLQRRLEALFRTLPSDAVKIIKELAVYEGKFTTRVLRKHVNRNIQTVPDSELSGIIDNRPVSVSLNRTPETIEDTYSIFAKAKIAQLMTIVSDSRVSDEDETDTENKVNNITNGLFSTQNLAIAGVAIIAGANMAREAVVFRNNMSVEWSAVLDAATCPYCEDQDGSVYDENDTADEIPAHSNCRCTWIPVE